MEIYMPLLQDSVQITLTPNVINHYEKLGYYIPRSRDSRGRMKVKEGTKIIVRIKDLYTGSGVKISMQCDICQLKFFRAWREHKDYEGVIYCKKCSGLLRSGENAYNWNPNLTEEERINGRDNKENREFVQRVLNRDHYTCKICGCNNNLHVHHLNGYNWCVSERTSDNNGVTLCDNCHNSFHSRFGHGNNTKEQFEEWIGSPIGELGEGRFPPARQVICMDDCSIYDSAPIAAKHFELDRNSLYPVLNRVARSIYNNHFLWLDDYQNMSKEDVCNYWRWVIGKA